MSRRMGWAAAAAMVASLGWVPVSAAGEPERASDAQRVEAKQRMQEGKRLHGEGKFEEAWLKFVQACAVLKTDNCIRGLAVVEEDAGKWVDAYDHVLAILSTKRKEPLSPTDLRVYSEMKLRLEGKTGHLAIDAPSAAPVFLDGSEVGVAPLEQSVTVMPGLHHVEARVATQTLDVDIEAIAGQVVPVKLSEPATVTPAAPVVTSAPMAVPAETPRDVPPQREAAWIASPVVPIALGVVAVGLGVGGVLSLVSANDDDDRASILRQAGAIGPSSCAAATAGACAELRSALDDRDAARSREVGFFVGTGVATAGVVAWLVWGRGATTTVTPLMGPGVAGGMLSGKF